MIAIIFEVWPHPDHKGRYLDIAAALKADLEQVEGFISVERFESLTTPGKILSLSMFEDDDAVMRWRTSDAHRKAQTAGRGGVFTGYRLRVASVMRDYGMDERRDEAPADSQAFHGS